MKGKGVGSETRFSCNFSGQRYIFLFLSFFLPFSPDALTQSCSLSAAQS